MKTLTQSKTIRFNTAVGVASAALAVLAASEELQGVLPVWGWPLLLAANAGANFYLRTVTHEPIAGTAGAARALVDADTVEVET